MAEASLSPLAGLRVLEVIGDAPLRIQLAVALAGKMARELGAEVLVVRQDGKAVSFEGVAGHEQGHEQCALHDFLYGDKDCLTAQASQLMEGADAILTDSSVALPSGRTAVVISDFGSNTRHENKQASELTILAMSGLLHVMGLQAGKPLRLPGHQPAYAAGLAAYIAMMAGLLSKEPRIADVSLLDAMLWVNWKLPAVAMLETDSAPTLGGEWQAVETKDGFVALVYQERDWPALVDMLAIPALRDARFATRSSRLKHYDDLLALLRPWFATRTKQQIYALSKENGLPLGPVWTAQDLKRDAQYLERDFLKLLPSGGFFPRLPVMWNGKRPMPGHLDHKAAAHG